MDDVLARTVSRCGTVRALTVVSTGVVEEARGRHGTAPTATAALGRALTGALLLAAAVNKRDERLSLEFSGDGPLRGVLVDATPAGEVRGFAYRPRTHVPPKRGKLDVGGAMGAGMLCVARVPLEGGQLYRSVVPLVSGEIGDDLASYLVASEQAPAALGVGVWVDREGTVGAAGGYLVQALPGADPEALETLAARIEAAPSPSAMVRDGVDAAGMIGLLLGDVAQPPLDVRPVRFQCRCSPARVRTAVLAMGAEEIAAALARERCVRATCEFCATDWVVDEAELRQLLA